MHPSSMRAWHCRHYVPFCRISPLVELRGWSWRSHGPIHQLAWHGGSSARIQEGFESSQMSALSSRDFCRRGSLADYLCVWLGGIASSVWSRAGRNWLRGSSGCGCEALCFLFVPAPWGSGFPSAALRLSFRHRPSGTHFVRGEQRWHFTRRVKMFVGKGVSPMEK